MMRFKLKGRTLLNDDIIAPEIPYAVFSDELVASVPEKIVAELNYGSRVLNILGEYHGIMDYECVAQMIKELKDAYSDYSEEQRRIEYAERSKS